MYGLLMMVSWFVWMGAAVGTILGLSALAHRLGLIKTHPWPSILRPPPGFKPDGGRRLDAMQRRWEIYEAIGSTLMWLVWAWLQYRFNQLTPR
jgi:hypothetical protein